MVKKKTSTISDATTIDSNSVRINSDISFIVDVTGSMGNLLNVAKNLLTKTVNEIEKDYPLINFKYSLIVYRDHPPQDSSFASKILLNMGGRSDLQAAMESRYFKAEGGGDTPESGLDAIKDLTSLKYRPDSIRHCFLIGDAHLHGTFDNKPCKCGLTSNDIVRFTEETSNKITAINISGASKTTESFKSITDDVLVSSYANVTTEIHKKLSALSEQVKWATTYLLPVLTDNKYMKTSTLAETLNVPITSITKSIEVLNTLGFTKNF